MDGNPWLVASAEQLTKSLGLDALLVTRGKEGMSLFERMTSGLRRVDIPKPQGGMRTLGIPTVVDRLIQQALHQVLQPIFEPAFSEASFGFRTERNSHQALRRAQHSR